MKIRDEQLNDQENCEKAFQLLLDLIGNNQHEIEPALWIGPMIAALADNFEKSDISFENFLSTIVECVKYYEY